MKKSIFAMLVLYITSPCVAQVLEVRPQFGHDPLWGDVFDNGRYAVTADRNTILLWDLISGDVILEKPFNCLGVQFLRGFPYYYVAADLLRDDGSFDSMYHVRSVINLNSGNVLFEIAEDEIKGENISPSSLIIPFDPKGRFEIVDRYGNLLHKWGGKLPGGISNLEISPNGNQLLVSGKHPVIWDLERMSVIHEIPLYEKFMQDNNLIDAGLDIIPFRQNSFNFKGKANILHGWRQFFKAHFTEDGHIISGAPNSDIYLFSPEGDLLKTYKIDSAAELVYDCVKTDSLILAATSKSWAFVGRSDTDSLKLCRVRAGTRDKTYRIVYEILSLPDRDSFICTTDGSWLYLGHIFELSDGLIPISMGDNCNGTLALARIDNDTIFVTQVAGKYSYFSLSTLTAETYEWVGVAADLQSCAVLKDGRILLGANSGRIGIIEKGEKLVTKEVSYGFGQIRGIVEDAARSHIYVSSSDGALRILDSTTLSLIATCYYLGDHNSITFTPDGYYSADKGVANLVMYGRGLELYSFDRFDLARNRPDIIRERLGGPKDEVNLLNKVYKKRLRRMGFNEYQLQDITHLPEIAITRFPLSREVAVDKITISAQFRDPTYSIAKILGWLNGTPLFGRDGLSVDGNELTKEFEIQLASGENNIEISCINAAGVESLREKRTITYANPRPKKDLYIIAVGVSEYLQFSHNLRFAAKDAEDIAELFKESGEMLYDNVHSLTLTNQDVGLDALAQIRTFIAKAKRDDSIIAFYAGHGLINSEYDYFLSTHTTDFRAPELSAIKYEDFENIFDGILAQNKLILIDACHSGEIDKEDVQLVVNNAISKGKVSFRGAYLGTESIENQTLKAQFNDLKRGLGATILAASSGLEVAVESEEWHNGLYTWVIREGVEKMAADANDDGIITVSELMYYGESQVSHLSQGMQSPSARSMNLTRDFVIRAQGL